MKLSDLACQLFFYEHDYAQRQRRPALAAHIQEIFTLKEDSRCTSAQRNAARDRLTRIFGLAHEDERRNRASLGPDPRDIANRYDELLKTLDHLRKTRLRDRIPPKEKPLSGALAPARDTPGILRGPTPWKAFNACGDPGKCRES